MSSDTTTTGPVSATTDPDFLAFLFDRLCEEVLAATYRRETGAAGEEKVTERGLEFLDQIVLDLKDGKAPDTMTQHLLVYAYGNHPDFRDEWNPWRV